MDGADLLLNFGAEGGGNGVKTGDGDFVESTLLDFVFDAFEVAGQELPPVLAPAEDALGQGLGFGGAEVGDIELMLAAPLDEGGFGDVEFSGNAVEAQTLRAQENETGNGL